PSPPPPEPAPATAAAPAKATKTVAGRTPPHPAPTAAHAVTSVPAQPVPIAAAAAVPPDPYSGGTDLDAEGAKRVTPHQADLARCTETMGAVHGQIKIAFQVLASGEVAHAAAVENTTGSQALGSCLASVLGTWTFASHPGEPTNFVRPFAYP